MTHSRPTGHFIFVILCVPAIPFGLFVAACAVVFGIEIPKPSTAMIDLSEGLALISAMATAAVCLVLALVWALVHMRRDRGAVGSLAWAGIFAAVLFIVNFAVFNGLVVADMNGYSYWDGQDSRGYGEAIKLILARPDGWMVYLFLWPVLPVAFFATHWRIARRRTFAIPS